MEFVLCHLFFLRKEIFGLDRIFESIDSKTNVSVVKNTPKDKNNSETYKLFDSLFKTHTKNL